MQIPSTIQPIRYAGHACLQLSTRHGVAIVALHGAQVLSWVPAGHRDVLWLSAAALPEPAAIRGGIPVCWPWFGKQGMPPGGMQHGPVRNRQWEVCSVHASSAEQVSLSLSPCVSPDAQDALRQFAPDLRLTMRLDLSQAFTQTLETHNLGTQEFPLTQALHTYFSVQDATQVTIEGLENLRFEDKLMRTTDTRHQGAFQLHTACDRIYLHDTEGQTHHYTLDDPRQARRIHVHTQGSQSAVVWNPGEDQASSMADVPLGGWRNFVCLEAANAGRDVIRLRPGGQHRLSQTLAVEFQPA